MPVPVMSMKLGVTGDRTVVERCWGRPWVPAVPASVPTTPARSADGRGAQAGERGAQVVGRADRVDAVGGLLVGGVEDGLEGVVARRAAVAADDQRVGAGGGDRRGLEHDRLRRRPTPVAEATALPPGSSSVSVPIRLGSTVRTSVMRLVGRQRQGVGVGVADVADAAADRRVVDQAARRGLAHERRGIGGGGDVDDVGAAEGQVADAVGVEDRARPAASGSGVPSCVTPESVRSTACDVSGRGADDRCPG